MYYKKVCFITNWDRYYNKLRQELLQRGARYLLQSGLIVIVKWGKYLICPATLLKSGATIAEEASTSS